MNKNKEKLTQSDLQIIIRARDESTKPTELAGLAKKTTGLARLVALNQTVPAELLQALGSHQDREVRKCVAGHCNTPPETLFELAGEFPEIFLENPALDLLFVANPNLVDDIPPGALVALLRIPDVPPNFVSAGLGHREPMVREAAAANINIQPETLLNLVSDSIFSVVNKAACGNPAMPAEVLAQLGKSPDEHIRRAVAANPSTPTRTLSRLASDRSESVIMYVAANPGTPPKILEKLATSSRSKTRRNVAQNPSTPLETLLRLVSDQHDKVRIGLTRNPAAPLWLLEKLSAEAGNAGWWIRRAIMDNPAASLELRQKQLVNENWLKRSVAEDPETKPELLSSLAADHEPEIRQMVASNLETPQEALSELANDRRVSVRERVAGNLKASPRMLQLLGSDHDSRVRWAVAENPATPIETLMQITTDQ